MRNTSSRLVAWFTFLFFCFFEGSTQNTAWADSDQKAFVNNNASFFRLFFADRADARVGYQYGFKREEENGPGAYTLHHFFTRGEFPDAITKNFFLRWGWEYGFRNYVLEQVDNILTTESSLDVHRLVGRFGAGWFIDRDLLLTGVLRPGLYSDFADSVDLNEGTVYGDGLIAYAINPGTQIIGGLTYDHTFDSEGFYPLLGMRIMSNDGRLHISITAPRDARIGYALSPQTEMFMLGDISGDQYKIEAGSAKSRFNLLQQERRVGLGISYWASKVVNLEAELGMLLSSKFKFRINKSGQFGDEVDHAPYFRMSLGLAF